MYLRSALALEKHNPAEESNKRWVQIWPQEIIIKNKQSGAGFLSKASPSLQPAQFMSKDHYMSYFKHVRVFPCVSHWAPHPPKKRGFWKKKNTSVIYEDAVVGTILLSTMLNTKRYTVSQQRQKRKKKSYRTTCSFWLDETRRNLLSCLDDWAKSTGEIMTDGISDHSACSEGTDNSWPLTYARIYLQLADKHTETTNSSNKNSS